MKQILESVEFYIDDVFPPNKAFNVYMIHLSIAINDLQVVYILINELLKNKKLKKKKNKDDRDRRFFYLFRLHCSHLREALKLLNEGETNNQLKSEFNNLFKQLPKKEQNLLDRLHQHYIPWENSFLKNLLKPIRDNFFHYNIENGFGMIKNFLSKNFKNESRIKFGRGKFKDLYLRYADEYSAYNMKGFLDRNNISIEEALDKVINITETLLDFFQTLLGVFLSGKKIKRNFRKKCR